MLDKSGISGVDCKVKAGCASGVGCADDMGCGVGET